MPGPPARPTRTMVGYALFGALVSAAVLTALVCGARPDASPARVALSGPATSLSGRCERTAHDAASLTREYEAARGGETICLESGSYGTFHAGSKGGLVGVRAKRGARAEMKLAFTNVTNLRLEDVVIGAAEIGGTARDITIAHSRFTGLAVVRAEQMVDANLVFDGNVHADIDTCVDCFQGRLHIDGNNGQPSGIVVKNSVFSGGNSDGVRPDADSVQVIGNEFHGFRDEEPHHTDPIQLYGGTRTVIRGNHFHDNAVSAQIMMADGGVGNIVEDNVISGDGYIWAITWLSDDGSIIRHNTFEAGSCAFNVRCGMLNIGSKPEDPPGKGTIIRDNVISGISDGGPAQFTAEHNLTAVRVPGARNQVGRPRFRGPLGRYSGYRLAAGSPGRKAASDGEDLGIR